MERVANGDLILTLYVNGKKLAVQNPDPGSSLLQYLRSALSLTGTKLGCGEGGCGACTVMISKYDAADDRIIHYAVNACLVPLCSLHGLAVTTIEGIGGSINRLHIIQERLVAAHGTQCGFCTPGMVMSTYALLRSNPQPSLDSLMKALAGNLCRCTGYRPIVEGLKTFTREFYCPMGSACCRVQKQDVYLSDCSAACGTSGPCSKPCCVNQDRQSIDSTQEPIFPPELKVSSAYRDKLFVVQGQHMTWYRPVTLKQVMSLMQQFPEANLVAGNTQIGLDTKSGLIKPTKLICVTEIPQLNLITWSDSGVTIGASVTMSRLKEALIVAVQSHAESRTRGFAALLDALNWFASQQVQNVATVGGHVMTGSPIADLNSVLAALGASVDIHCAVGDSQRTLRIDEAFFNGPSRTALKQSEILLNINVPFTKEGEFVHFYKQARRRENSKAIVNAGLRVQLHPVTLQVDDARVVFGGLATTAFLAFKAAKGLVGKHWSKATIETAIGELHGELQELRGCSGEAGDEAIGDEAIGDCSWKYKTALAAGFMFKFYVQVHDQLSRVQAFEEDGLGGLTSRDLSAAMPLHVGAASSIQVYEDVDPAAQVASDLVGRPTAHRAAKSQAVGEAQYTDDLPPAASELYFVPVRSTKPHAKVVAVDSADALAMPGVVDYISHADVPEGKNTVPPDEIIFAVDEVHSYGQIIGAILAVTPDIAVRAAGVIKVTYEEKPAIITIEDAIATGSFYEPVDGCILENGDIKSGFKAAEIIIEGQLSIGGQHHFYLEPPCIIVVPGENNEYEVRTGTQAQLVVQQTVASVLGIPANRVVVRTKRIGGGFGGKEYKLMANLLPVVIAAHKLKRPVRYTMSREEDTMCTGGRHPCLAKYKVGACRDGKLVALAIEVFGNAGCTTDLSPVILSCIVKRLDNCYNIPNIRIVGKMCKTNIPSNSAMRGFGGPQAMLIMEHIMTDIAEALGLSQIEVREKNFYREGDSTPYKQVLKNCHVSDCWEGCIAQSNFAERQAAIDLFNRENRWKKRGLAIVPTKFSLGLGPQFMHQAGALVMAYTDGSVTISHGGIEMGQGLHTKIVQVATRALKIDESKIYICETSTAAVPNATASVGSLTTDLNGMAVKDACEVLLQRLQPFISANPGGKWDDWVQAAYLAQVSLAATGFYKYEGITMTEPYLYFAYGAACSEVEIDCLTGDHQILRTDIVMDVGRSLNPAVDIGQIEGAFMQGYGMMCLEEVSFTAKGYPLTKGPNSYTIPSFGNIPRIFNVSLLKNVAHPTTIYGSKAVGEPPLFLAASVFFAVKDAVKAARSEIGLTGSFCFDSPATPERIRMSCTDNFGTVSLNGSF